VTWSRSQVTQATVKCFSFLTSSGSGRTVVTSLEVGGIDLSGIEFSIRSRIDCHSGRPEAMRAFKSFVRRGRDEREN